MSAEKRPTFARFQKVEAILEGDKMIKSHLGPKTEIVCKPPPSNEKVKFARPVVYITEAFHAKGLDAHTVSKGEVIKAALNLIREGGGEFKLPNMPMNGEPPPAAPEPEKPKAKAKPKVEVKPDKIEPEKPEPPKVKPEPVKPVKVSAVAVAKASKSVPEPVKVPKSEPTPDAPQTAVGKAAVEDEVKGTPAQRVLRPGFPLIWGVSAVTLLMAVDQIMEAQDTAPGKAERQQKLADLIKDYQALSILPKSSVKET